MGRKNKTDERERWKKKDKNRTVTFQTKVTVTCFLIYNACISLNCSNVFWSRKLFREWHIFFSIWRLLVLWALPRDRRNVDNVFDAKRSLSKKQMSDKVLHQETQMKINLWILIGPLHILFGLVLWHIDHGR